MSPRSVALLALSALLLGGYVVLFECGGGRGGTAGDHRILPGLQRDAVRGIRIVRQGAAPIQLRRTTRGWELRGAVKGRADRALVERLLSLLEFMEPLRGVPAQGNRRQLGLAPPRAAVRLATAGGARELLLGRADPSGQGVYLAHGPKSLVVVSRELLDLVQLDADAWRDRDLVALDGPIRSVHINRQSASVLELQATGGVWMIGVEGQPGQVRADPREMRRLLGAAGGLRAVRFRSKAPGDAKPALKIELRGRGKQRVRLALLGACPGRPNETVVSTGSLVACVVSEDLKPLLQASHDSLVDRRLTWSRTADLRGIRIERQGAPRVALSRTGAGWRLAGGEAADSARIEQWVARLAATEASVVVPWTASAGAAVRARVLLEREDGGVERLQFMADGKVRRGQETVQLQVDAARVDQLVGVDAVGFRSRQLLSFSRHLVVRVVTVRGAEKEVVERGDRGWWVVQPVRARADQRHMERLVQALSRLRGVRVLAGTPPAGERTLELMAVIRRDVLAPGDAGVQEDRIGLRLRLGREGDCNARALTEGAPWNELDRQTCTLLSRRRADAQLLRFDEGDLRSIEVEGQVRLVASKQGPDWISGAGAALPAGQLAELIRLLGLLKGEVVSYGEPGLGPIRIKLRLGLAGGRQQRCRIDRQGRAAVDGAKLTYRLQPDKAAALERLVAGLARGATRER